VCDEAYRHSKLSRIIFSEATSNRKLGISFEAFYSRLTIIARAALLDEVQIRLAYESGFGKYAGRTAHWVSDAVAELGGNLRHWASSVCPADAHDEI
jgi:hypothetical protein